MEIYLLRHGQSTANEKMLVCGASDYPLSKLGRKQSALVCEALNKIKFDHIYCSPLSRARQTINELKQGIEIHSVSDLAELNTGNVSHLTVDELWARDPRYRYQGLNPDHRYPEGECLREMLARVQRWFETERAKWCQGQKILVAGHEGTVCGILHGILNLEINNYPTFKVGNCDYVQISFNSDSQIRIHFFTLGLRCEE